jgi:NAD(P)-dependent dehydrogenase (short-subunit alcohol dehydrogenase family)
MSLAGRITLVTGASRGIGRGCAKALADQGATVYITGRKLETLSKTAKEIGGDVIPVVCDHSNDDQGILKYCLP